MVVPAIIVIIGWVMKRSERADPVDVKRNVTTRGRWMKLAAARIRFVDRNWPRANFECRSFILGRCRARVVLGVTVSFLLMATIQFGPAFVFDRAFWNPAKPWLQKRRIASLEEPSPL